MGLSIEQIRDLRAKSIQDNAKTMKVTPHYKGCMLTRNIVAQYESQIRYHGYVIKFSGWSDRPSGPVVNIMIYYDGEHNQYQVTIDAPVARDFIRGILGHENYCLMYDIAAHRRASDKVRHCLSGSTQH